MRDPVLLSRTRSEGGKGDIPGAHRGWAELRFPSLRPQSRTYLGMSTLRDLIFKRPSRQFQYLHVLLDLSSHEKDKVIPWHPVLGCTPPFPCPEPLAQVLPHAPEHPLWA